MCNTGRNRWGSDKRHSFLLKKEPSPRRQESGIPVPGLSQISWVSLVEPPSLPMTLFLISDNQGEEGPGLMLGNVG